MVGEGELELGNLIPSHQLVLRSMFQCGLLDILVYYIKKVTHKV